MVLLLVCKPAAADGGKLIQDCVAALPATGGVCDFRNQGALTAASTIVVNKPVALLLDGTQLTVYGAPGILIEANGVRLEGTAGQSKLIQGGSLGNTGYNRNVIYGSTVENFNAEGIDFVGLACSVPADNNSGIKFQNSTSGYIRQIKISANTFTGFCLHAVHIQNASDVLVEDNIIAGVVHGIRFSGVVRGKILNNVIRDAELGSSRFAVAIGLDTTAQQDDGISYPVSSNIQISHNTVQTYVNGEAVMVHSGTGIVISNNIFDDVLMGIGANPFNSTDTMHNIAITGNSFTGTTTPGAATSTGNYGVYVGGGPSTTVPSYVVVANNVICDANKIVRSPHKGGIGIGRADGVLIENNLIHDVVANGIVLASTSEHVTMQGNDIQGVSVDRPW